MVATSLGQTLDKVIIPKDVVCCFVFKTVTEGFQIMCLHTLIGWVPQCV